MKKILVFLLFLLGINASSLHAQTLTRSSMNCIGSTLYQDKMNLQQTAGQSGNYSNFYANQMVLRQGFLQSGNTAQNNFFNQASIGLYPNPNQGSFFLQIKSAATTQINLQIFNVMGDLVHQQNINTNQNNEISLDKISAGVYFVRMLNENQEEYNTKLIIQ
jgi:hypothetical protein